MQKFLRTLMLTAAMLLPFASQAQVTVFPYNCDFEDATEAAAWTLENGTLTNQWVLGTAVNNTTSGSYGIYISNDAGASTAYTITSSAVVYAYREFYFTPGEYTVSFDWQCNGESTWDYLLAALVESSVTLTAGTSLPTGVSYTAMTATGWTNLGPTSPNLKMNLSTTWNTQTATFTITTAGTYRIVFVWRNDASGGTAPGACIDNVVVTQNSCPTPSGLLCNNITTSSLDLTWTELGSASSWLIYVNGEFATTANSTSYNITGLDANTAYAIEVRSLCGVGDTSNAVAGTFRTACPVTVALPYFEQFNGYSGFQSNAYTGPSISPACWGYYSNGTNTAATTTSAYYGGVYQYTTNSSYASMEANNPYLCLPIYVIGSNSSSTYINYRNARGDVKYAIMPAFATPISGLQIGFDYKMSTAYSASGAATMLELGYITGDDISTFVSMWSANSVTTMQQVVDLNLSNLAAAAPADARLAFKFHGTHNGTSTSSGSAVYCGIDNILVENLPSCARVTNLTAIDITNNSVTLNWVDTINIGATYVVYNDTALVATGVACSTYTVTGLDANTQYTFRVLTSCSANDHSAATTCTIRTLCDAEELPFVETFDATLSSNQCWRGANNATAAQVFSGTALTLTSLSSWTYASSARDGLEAGHYYKNVYGPNQKAWMITPAIDLTNVSSAQLSFDVALTDYSNAALPDVNGDTNNSQAFMVIVSTDGGNTWSANNATIWQNEGGDYTYASLASTTYQNKVIDLTQYVGNTIKIAFYTQSIWTGGDNDLHIDNIAVTQASSCPAPVVTVDNFMNRTVSFSWTSTADSVIVGLYDNYLQPVTLWFAPATGSVTNYTLPDNFPFGYGYVVAWSVCGAYSDENLSLNDYDVFAVTCNAEEQCPVTFLLTDEYGDGWNGGALDIYDTVSGLIVGSMTCPDYGLEDSVITHTTIYNLCPGRVYSIVYRSGSYDNEVSFTILGTDSTVYGSFSNPTEGVLGYFTHTCPATGCVAETFPFSEDFEDGVLSECWTIDGPGNWTVGTGDYSSSTGAHTGSYNVKINHSSTGNVTKLISPVIDMTGVANAELRFWHIQRSWAGDQDELTVYYRTSATGEWQSLATYSNEVSTWTEEIIMLTNLSSTYQIAFEMTDGYGYGVSIDDITIDLPPACSAVSGLTASAITNNSVTLEWTDDFNTGATYTVYELNATGSTAIASNINGTTYTVTNLTGHTSYTFGVVANCSADVASTTTTLAVTTMADPIMCGSDVPLSFANADSITTTTQYMPAYSYYNYSYSEVIIPVTRLLGLGEIKGMEFYVNSVAAGSSHFNNCEIYLMNTSATSLTNGFIQDASNMQLVFSGDLNHDTTGWKLVTFDTSFMYDGVSNLLVAVRRGDGTWASAGDFGAYTADASIARYIYNDNNAYIIGSITGGYVTSTAPVYHMIGCAGNAPDCMPISNLTVTNVNAYDVTLSWADNNNTGATYSVYQVDATGNTLVASGITTTNYTVTGLTPETAYTFAVEANCSATTASLFITVSTTTPPSCLPVTNIAVSDLTNTTATLSWDGNANNYLVVVTDGTNSVYNNVVNDTTVSLTGLTAETSYSVSIYAICDVDDTSAVATASLYTGYCLPNPTSVDNNGITSVSFGGMTNTTHNAVSGSAMYENFSNMVGSVPAGTTASVDITFATGYTYGTIIWVDWDNSMTFEGNEVVYVGTSASSNPTTLTATFDVPATQAQGNYRMRILASDMAFDSYTGSIAAAAVVNPCATFSWGVAEDYTLAVTDAPNCLAVTDLTVNGTTETSVTLSWTGNAASYDVYNGNTFVANVTANTYTFTGLTASTNYTFGVQAICSATDSATIVTVTASTSCGDVATLPYSEGFENGLGCWTTVNGSSDGVAWYIYDCSNLSTVNPHGGSYVASSWSWNNSAMHADAWLISPRFVLPTVTAGDNLTLSWWDIANANYPDSYSVAISTTNNDTASFTVVRPSTQASGDWTMRSIDLTSYAGQSVYIAFHHVDYDENYLLIDDIAVTVGAPVLVLDSMKVTVAVNDATMGTTIPAPGVHYFYEGDTCSVVAVPNTGYHLQGWSLYVTMIYGGIPTVVLDTTLATTLTDVFDLFGGWVVESGDNIYEMTVTANFEVDPTCYAVTGLNVTAATSNSVSLSWTDANNTGATYTVYNMADSSVVATGIAATTYTVTGLNVATNYTFGVVANCSSTDASVMTTIMASTECDLISVFPYSQDFTSVPACWSAMDVDGDGNGWEFLMGAMHSASYDNNYGPLTPDNWLITPHFQLAQGTNYEVTWNANPQDASWPAEHYGLYVSTTGNLDTSSFTLIQEWTLTSTGHVPVVDLSSYAGQNIYLAFRHWNCTDMFRIAIDNFELREQAGSNQITVTLTQNNPMYGSVSGGGVYTIGDNVTVTATAAQDYTFSRWADVTGATISTANPYTFVAATDITLQAIFISNTAETYDIIVDVNDSTMGYATGSGNYTAGDNAVLTAYAYEGYRFVNWTWNDMPLSTDNPFSMTVTSNSSLYPIVANFEVDTTTPEEYMTLITAVNDATMGTITPAPGEHQYYLGDHVQFTATPNEGYHYENVHITITQYGLTFIDTVVYEDLSDLDLDVEEEMLGAVITVTVNFAPNGSSDEYVTLYTQVNDPSMGTMTPAPGEHHYYAGDNIHVSVTPYEGYRFDNAHVTVTMMGIPVLDSIISMDITDFDFEITQMMLGAVINVTVNFAPVNSIDVAGQLNDLKVYPNPTHGKVTVDADDVVKVDVMDLNGRIVTSFENTNSFDISNLATGSYVLRIETLSGVAIKRVVKK